MQAEALAERMHEVAEGHSGAASAPCVARMIRERPGSVFGILAFSILDHDRRGPTQGGIPLLGQPL